MENWISVELCSGVNDWICGIAVDAERNVYFTAGRGGLWILEYKSNQPRLLQQEDTMYMHGIVWDGKETFYISDSIQHRILQYRNGVITVLTGNPGTGKGGYQDGDFKDAAFCNPYGVTMDHNGNLLVTDCHHVRKINLEKQTVETIAGNTTEFGNGGFKDGDALEARFSFPSSVAVDKDGIIYVNDKGNHCIRRIKDGIVSTFDDHQCSSGFQQGIKPDSLFQFPEGLALDNYGNLLVLDTNKLHQVNLNFLNVTTSTLKVRSTKSLAMDNKGAVYIGSSKLFKVYNTWNTERYLWIAHFKEDSSYCELARLPKDIIKELAAHLVTSIKGG